MKFFFTSILFCVFIQISAQTSSNLLLPAKFSITTKQWVLQQYKNAAQGQVVLYKENLAVCGINYGCLPSGGPLPVTGLELTAQRISNDQAKLFWKTYTEINNKGFDVERTFDVNAAFTAIHFVNGSNYSYSEKLYELMDDNRYQGTSYYRLKQINFDGSYSYSNIASVKGFTTALEIKPYPNPASASNINFEIKGLKAGTIFGIVIHNNLGKLVYESQHIQLTNTYTFNCKELLFFASGVYHIRIFSNDKKATTSFILTGQ